MDPMHTPAGHNNSYSANSIPQSTQPTGNYGGYGTPSQPARMAPPAAPSAGPFNNMVSINGARPRMKPEVGNFPSAENPDVLTLLERLVERRHDGVLAVFDPEERERALQELLLAPW